METTNENIRQLLEMLDHPEAYTEQEIHDIINHDEDTRETYRLMVEAKRGSRSRHDDTPVDVDAAWQRFNQRLQPKQQGQGWMKIAAHYDATVTFANDKARQFRFRFVWNPQQDIDQVVSDLNQFESLTVTLKDNQITVE